jgi:hypothetical protein
LGGWPLIVSPMKRLAVVLLVILSARPTYAWNETGHKAIALLAYHQLTPATKTRVDQLLSRHPDYAKWVRSVAASDRGRAAFLAAAIWPDTIKGDARFHDDDKPPTANIAGLPPGAQARHGNWHYTNLPFSPDGTTAQPPAAVNIVTKLREFEGLSKMPDSMKIYVLPWIIHLVGDSHQPLHTVARFDRLYPSGDRGGNAIVLKSGNLHSYWDSRLGTSVTDRFLDQLTKTIQQQHPKLGILDMNPERWAQEGFALRLQVYGFSGNGTPQSPAILSDTYAQQARATAYGRAALAAYRLAEFLNQRLK